eukprot:symbB.v1.2.013448.t1/scaffold955.1/size149113/1
MATAPGHGAGHPSVPCPQLPPAPPVPSVVALTLPPDPAFPQPESKNLRIVLQSIRGQATVLEVQRWGCASLRDLAQESAEDRSWLGRLGGIELVLNAMRTFQSDTELQQCACGALATLSYENQANPSGVLQHGGVELLLRAMHAHSSSSAVQGLACYVLRILAVLEEGREHMVQLGGIETIFVALRNHIEDVELQGSGCGVLGRLTACSSEDLATVSSADGLGVALRALASHPDDSQVQACASALLGNLVLAGSNSVQDIAGSGKAAQLLVHALGHQSSEAQSCAISALNNMCLRSEDCVAQAAVNGAYAPLATTFQHQDERGQLFAITVLYLLAMQDKGDMMDFVRLQGLSHLIPIMMHLMSSLKVQEQISSILQRFGSRSEILDEILYQGGLAAILTAMHRFPMSPRIQVSGCFLTAHWARSGPDEAQRVAEAGGVELVAAAMQKHLAQANWGERGTRGIRGGKAARRKRDAFRRYESERLGIPIDQVAVVHQGGQSRPLHTSPYWIPDQSEVEVVSSDEAVEAVEAPASDQVDDSVRIFVPIVSDGRYQLKEVTETLRRIEGPIVAVDYRQVLDIDRSERPWVSISDEGLLPERNVYWFRYINQKLHDIAGPRQSSSLLCVLSFVHSEERLRSSLRAIEKSRLKTGAVIFTRTPVGRGGKADTLKGILHPEVSPARVVLIDDRLETIREAVQLNQFGIHVQ